MSIGKKPDLKKKTKQYSYIKYLQLEEGKTVKEISNWKSVIKLPGVVFTNVSIKKGETVPKITDSSKRPGFVIVKGDSREKVMNLAEKYLQVLREKIKLN